MGLNRTNGRYRRINNIDIADGGGLGNASLFMFLKEECVDVGADIGKTCEPREITFFLGQIFQIHFIRRQLLSNRFLLFLDSLHGGMRFGVVGKQCLFLHFQFGIGSFLFRNSLNYCLSLGIEINNSGRTFIRL